MGVTNKGKRMEETGFQLGEEEEGLSVLQTGSRAVVSNRRWAKDVSSVFQVSKNQYTMKFLD